MACRSSKRDSTFFEHNPMNTPTPTPRTDSAWAQTFDASGFLFGRGNAASQMRDECATLERELTALTAEREKAERYRLVTLKQDAELATERARLDSGTILLTVAGERVWHCGVDLRAAIDAAMKEDAK
jgi:hypothetical protein